MSKEKFYSLITGATKKFKAEGLEAPPELIDRPNGVVYPVFERPDTPAPDFSAMAGMGHSPQGAMALQLGEDAMSQYGGAMGMMGGNEGDAPGMAPAADPMAMMMGMGGAPGGPQGPAPQGPQQPSLFPGMPPGEPN